MFEDLFDTISESGNRRHRYIDNTTNSVLRMDALDAKARAREAATEIAFLKQKVEKLMMISEALWLFLKETNNLTDEDLKEKIIEIDLKDGQLDGKVSANAEAPDICTVCGQVLQKNKYVCIYCGAEINNSNVFKR